MPLIGMHKMEIKNLCGCAFLGFSDQILLTCFMLSYEHGSDRILSYYFLAGHNKQICPRLIIKAPEKGVKFVQSKQ